MARLARTEVFAPDEVAVVQVMNRVVRRCFLLGDDPVTGKNDDHRILWIEDLLKRFSAAFGIDLLGFAILSNHFPLILRSRPDVVTTWTDADVARRWLRLCPFRKTSDGLPAEPTPAEIETIRNNPEKLAAVRQRLSDIGWWMRLLCQQVATRANRDDREVGKFWQSRSRAVRLLDEPALLACAACVDLNPIRAALAERLETSDFTSVQRRIQAMPTQPATSRQTPARAASSIPSQPPRRSQSADIRPREAARPLADVFLAPVSREERTGQAGPVPNTIGLRCRDKGFLPVSWSDDLGLLDWTSRQAASGQRGRTPPTLKPIFERLALDPQTWCSWVGSFGRLFDHVAGLPETMESTTSRVTAKRDHIPAAARTLLAKADPSSPA